MMQWFMTIKKDVPLFFKELPIDTQEIERMPDQTVPRTELQALMQVMPGYEELPSEQTPNPIREALLNSMEMLTEQDKYVLDAIYWEMITFAELGKRLGVSAPHAWRLTEVAEKNLKEFLLMNTTLRDFILNEL